MPEGFGAGNTIMNIERLQNGPAIFTRGRFLLFHCAAESAQRLFFFFSFRVLRRFLLLRRFRRFFGGFVGEAQREGFVIVHVE